MTTFYMRAKAIDDGEVIANIGEPVKIVASGPGGILLVMSDETKKTFLTGIPYITIEAPVRVSGLPS